MTLRNRKSHAKHLGMVLDYAVSDWADSLFDAPARRAKAQELAREARSTLEEWVSKIPGARCGQYSKKYANGAV